jgi:hypothetical protein
MFFGGLGRLRLDTAVEHAAVEAPPYVWLDVMASSPSVPR